MAGLNGGMLGVPNAGLMAGVNGPLANAAVPAMLAGGLNQALVAGGAAGLLGQQRFAQGNAGGAMPQPQQLQQQQQLPVQLDPARRFRRQLMKEDNVVQTTEDSQIETATETTPLPCDEDGQLDDY
ncbi:uncharacterized protein V6R79_019905 [Siganus canaliculatus]